MPGGFKDLSELHIAAVESGQPEMFHKVLEAAMWRADRKHDLSSSSSKTLERVMNSIRNGLGMRETEIASEPS